MEIAHHTRDTLVLEDKSTIARVFILALGGAGVLLLLSSMEEYGFQAWYRLTHWGGAAMAIAGILVYLNQVFIRRVHFSVPHQQITISTLRGLSWNINQTLDVSSVQELSIERKAVASKELYRLVMITDTGRIPVQRSFSQDYVQVEQAAKVLQQMLG